jgi:hypothetical protein
MRSSLTVTIVSMRPRARLEDHAVILRATHHGAGVVHILVCDLPPVVGAELAERN